MTRPSDLKADRRLHSWFLGLRRFKVLCAVIYALFILVIYSHALLARRQFTLRRSYLKVAGRALPCTDGPRTRGSGPLFGAAALDNGRGGKVGKETGDDAGEKKGSRRRVTVARRQRGRGSALLRARSRQRLWTVGGAQYKKSRPCTSTHGGYFMILKRRDRGKTVVLAQHFWCQRRLFRRYRATSAGWNSDVTSERERKRARGG